MMKSFSMYVYLKYEWKIMITWHNLISDIRSRICSLQIFVKRIKNFLFEKEFKIQIFYISASRIFYICISITKENIYVANNCMRTKWKEEKFLYFLLKTGKKMLKSWTENFSY